MSRGCHIRLVILLSLRGNHRCFPGNCWLLQTVVTTHHENSPAQSEGAFCCFQRLCGHVWVVVARLVWSLAVEEQKRAIPKAALDASSSWKPAFSIAVRNTVGTSPQTTPSESETMEMIPIDAGEAAEAKHNGDPMWAYTWVACVATSPSRLPSFAGVVCVPHWQYTSAYIH